MKFNIEEYLRMRKAIRAGYFDINGKVCGFLLFIAYDEGIARTLIRKSYQVARCYKPVKESVRLTTNRA